VDDFSCVESFEWKAKRSNVKNPTFARCAGRTWGTPSYSAATSRNVILPPVRGKYEDKFRSWATRPGPFGAVSVNAGDVLGGSADAFAGPSPDGYVTGVGATGGFGMGISTSATITGTLVQPLIGPLAPPWSPEGPFGGGGGGGIPGPGGNGGGGGQGGRGGVGGGMAGRKSKGRKG
jgi:hypothetical protein